jgi:hypothetical protein
MWPEFVRKITILLLYDRLNAKHFRPKYWKPGSWFLAENNSDQNNNYSKQEFDKLAKPSLFKEKSEVKKLIEDTNSLLDISKLMSHNIDIDSFKPYDFSDFGSFNYVIRSRNFREKKHSQDAINFDEYDPLFKFKTSKSNHGIQVKQTSHNLNNNSNENLNSSFSFNVKPFKLSKNTANQTPKKSSNENLNQLIEEANSRHFNNNSSNDFEYSKVTDDIYKTFGKPRHSKFSYPQQITVLNKPKSNKVTNSNREEFMFPDFNESSTFSKTILSNNNNNFFDQSLVQGKSTAPLNKYSNILNQSNSRIDNGGNTSSMSSSGNFHNSNKNNKLLKILGEI